MGWVVGWEFDTARATLPTFASFTSSGNAQSKTGRASNFPRSDIYSLIDRVADFPGRLLARNNFRFARYTFGILRRARFEKGATGPEALTLAIRLRRNHDSGSD